MKNQFGNNFPAAIEKKDNKTATITSSRGNPMSLVGTPTFVSATSGSNSTTLTVNGTITYTATFTVNDLSIKDGGLFNTITFTGIGQIEK